MWGRMTPRTTIGCGWNTALESRIWGSWIAPSNGPLQKKRPTVSWPAWGGVMSASWGGDPSLLHWWNTWNAESRSEWPSVKGVWMNWSETSEGLQRWLRDWSIYCAKSLEELGLFSLEKGSQGEILCVSLSLCLKIPGGGWTKKKEPDFS